jgi:pimeloyl-ACP methyl ester carboxylesterase
LHTLLTKAKVPGPFVLVGHSLGGILARLYASFYPAEVAGMVLVDSAHEDEADRAVALTPPDVLREMLRQARPEDLTPRTAERVDGCSIRTLMNALDWRADIPLVVLTQGTPYGPDAVAVPSTAPAAYRLHLELQRELARRSPRGRHVIAEKSGHAVHQDRPELVVQAIREVLGASKKRPAR